MILIATDRAAGHGCEVSESLILTASDRASDDRFGTSVAIDGDWAVVGAPNDDDPALGSDVGSAYVYRFDGSSWTEVQKLAASDAAVAARFGAAVGLSGHAMVIGAPAHSALGAAYVYRFNGTTWIEEQRLAASDQAAGDFFGTSIAIDGTRMIVGAELDDDPALGVDAGSAYVFEFDGSAWAERAKLTASDGAMNNGFGGAVSISQSAVVVGAARHVLPGIGGTGSAYIFRLNGPDWAEEQKLVASDAAAGDGFGFSVAMEGDAVIVGAYRDDSPDRGDEAGSAYVFRFDGAGWQEEQKLAASDREAFDSFGSAVGLAGDTVVVGAYHNQPGASMPWAGAAYLYRFSNGSWEAERKLLASNRSSADELGFSVAISGTTAIVGGRFSEAVAGTATGAAYIFAEVWQCRTWCGEKIVASTPAASDLFGTSVDIDGAIAVVGAPYGDHPGTRASTGTASVFRFTMGSWKEEQVLVASDAASGDQFGFSVGVNGDAIIVGAHLESGRGAAYVYRFDGSRWIEEQKLTASDGSSNDSFGYSVALGGAAAVVGAHRDDAGSAFDSGSAYVFRFDGLEWVEEAKLMPPDGTFTRFFGFSVDIGPAGIIVGAHLTDDPVLGAAVGAAHIYRFDGVQWVAEQILSASDRTAGDRFGIAVAIHEGSAVVGTERSGAYVYRANGSSWAEDEKLVPWDARDGDAFGRSVTLSGNLIVIGAYRDDIPGRGPSLGSAYAYRRGDSSWMEAAKLTASDGGTGDRFGTAVATDGVSVIIGASHDDLKVNRSFPLDAGSAYFFESALDCGPLSCVCERTRDEPAVVDTLDLLVYVDLWFGQNGAAELTGDSPASVDVFDLLAFLDCWFPASAGGTCP